ncbi:MAG: U32 family peptidase [Desulfobacterales bacterium]|nr:U32 family peptidase [Desulfobacterales bacterium]
MDNMPDKVELLAPAGNLEKLDIAMHYGADAVYLGGRDFSLRNFSGNFTLEEMEIAVTRAHRRGVKVYVACNIYARNSDLDALSGFLTAVDEIGADAVIAADPGVLTAARELIPRMPLHLSTQANTTNIHCVRFWAANGARRINMARELSLAEIREIASTGVAEIEAFVHGAMCMAYSGRCLLSGFLANRESNRGMCAHPCRWKYSVVEEFRPGRYMPIAEDDRGAYLFSSEDLCMIRHVPEMIRAGLTSLKIEGRMKGINYLASTVKVYREAIDAFYSGSFDPAAGEEWITELSRVNSRGFCTGFYFGSPAPSGAAAPPSPRTTEWQFAAKVIGRAGRRRTAVHVRNKIFKGDAVEVLSPGSPLRPDVIIDLHDALDQPAPFAQPGAKATLTLKKDCAPNDLIRKAKE